MSYRTAVAANAVLACAIRHKMRFSAQRVQALLYLIQGWSFARYGRPAVTESPEAWPTGPIFESLHFRLEHYGNLPVTHLLLSFYPASGCLDFLLPDVEDKDYWHMVDRVVDEYGRWSMDDLNALCREQDGAWHRARSAGEFLIPDQAMQSHFRRKFDEYASFIRQATAGGDGDGGRAEQGGGRGETAGDSELLLEGLLLPLGSGASAR